jgi:AraC-like DNA-binding protein
MIIKSKIKEFDEWLFMEEIPDTYLPDRVVTEKKVSLKRHPVEMTSRQLSASGIFLLYADMKCESPIHIHTEVTGETVTSQFVFYKLPSFKKLSIPGRSRHNIRYIPTSVREYEMKAGVDYSYFLMVLSKDYYFHLINRHSSLHEDFVQEIEKGEYVSFTDNDLLVTPEMIRIINDLKEGQKTGEVRRLHTEAKLMELLIYQLEQLNTSTEDAGSSLKPADIEKLEEARNILDANFVSPPPQKELSQIVALNESKLRRGFKEYFATTIYDYTVRLKMEYARKLLLEEKKTITETAELTGFNHQNNFSSAFKKYFGISPSDIRY